MSDFDELTKLIKDKISRCIKEGKQKEGSDQVAAPFLLDEWNQLIVMLKEKQKESLLCEDDGETGSCCPMERLFEECIPLFLQLWNKRNSLDRNYFKNYLALQKIEDEIISLQKSGLFLNDTVSGFQRRLDNLDHSLANLNTFNHIVTFQQAHDMILSKRKCNQKLVNKMQAELDAISPALRAIHQRLVEIKQELESLIARKGPHLFSLTQVQLLQEELQEIDSARIDGKYMAKNGEVVSGQASIIYLLEAGFEDCHELLSSRDPVDSDNPLRGCYEDLINIKLQLEKMCFAPSWLLKSNDLIPIQMMLGDIDNMRKDGIFLANPDATEIHPGQAVLHYLLHKCYRLVFKLQQEIEPVDQSLMPIYNQLQTLRRCLSQLVDWKMELGPGELVPYHMKMTHINRLRVDGNFPDSEGNIPEGQDVLLELLESCSELINSLGTTDK